MEIKTNHIELLLELLSKRTKQPLDLTGFGEMSGMMDSEVSQRYLYENLYRKKEIAKKNNLDTISVQASKLDLIAKYLKYDSYRLLSKQWETPLNKILVSCLGIYCNYVRRNSESGAIYCSPVKIEEVDGKIWFELKGPRWSYRGELSMENGCLFVLMKAEGGKSIHHVYRIGTRENPNVLQGIFSGVSTVFDPIGGRTVLIRKEGDFTALKNEELNIIELKKSKSLTDRRLAEYFQAYDVNNLSINKIITFTVDDLGGCK